MKEDRDEHHDTERRPHEKGAGDGHAVEKGVQQQAHQGRCAGHPVDGVRLLTEVEVGREGMLREVHREIAREHQAGGRRARASERLGEQLHQRHRQHEPRPERHEVLDQGQLARRASRHGEGAGDVPQGRYQGVQQRARHERAAAPACCAWGRRARRRAAAPASRPPRGRAAPLPR